MKGSKLLKLVGLGIALWGLSLLWPKVNLVLTPVVMIGLLVGLGLVMVAYSLGRQFGQPVNQPQASDRNQASLLCSLDPSSGNNLPGLRTVTRERPAPYPCWWPLIFILAPFILFP